MSMGELVDLRTCVVRVAYVRAVDEAGKPGFSITEWCPAENYTAQSFLYATKIPEPTTIAEHVLAFNDARGEGISGRGGAVREISRGPDGAVFEVTARVVGHAA